MNYLGDTTDLGTGVRGRTEKEKLISCLEKEKIGQYILPGRRQDVRYIEDLDTCGQELKTFLEYVGHHKFRLHV